MPCACRAEGADLEQPGHRDALPGFEKYFKDAAHQYRDFFKKMELPVVITSVDEPRERGLNSWNRNYADTIRYCDWLGEVGGIRVCCNPMGDITHGKDYTPMIDHVDVLSTHAWKNSEKFMKGALAKGKTLWLYNFGATATPTASTTGDGSRRPLGMAVHGTRRRGRGRLPGPRMVQSLHGSP